MRAGDLDVLFGPRAKPLLFLARQRSDHPRGRTAVSYTHLDVYKRQVKGVLSMARSSSPDSAGSQFFICHGDARFLDRQYTAFGELVSGEDVLEKIANVATGGNERSTPIERVALESVRIVPAEA